MKRDKEWFIKELLGHEIGDYGNYYNGGYEDDLAYALKLAHQLDDPEKVVIPQFVADWWERDSDSVTLYRGFRVKKKHKFDLVSNFRDMGLGDYLSKVEDWLDENNSIFLDLVNGKPYEVEKEKLYYIVDEKGQLLLFRSQERGILRSNGADLETVLMAYEQNPSNMYQLTEKEIKDYDTRYWAFAVPVEENT